MKINYLIWVCLLTTSAVSVHAQTQGTFPIPVADQYYWTGSEGNIGLAITGKFVSLEKMIETTMLTKSIGTHRGRQHELKEWHLHDILISIDFNGNGYVATWEICGPQPLLMSYLESLQATHEDRSVFYDFGYRILNFQPTAYWETSPTRPPNTERRIKTDWGSLELEQVFHQREVIIRLRDDTVPVDEAVICTIYREIPERQGVKSLKLTELTLNPVAHTPIPGCYIGIYRDEVEFPHGTTARVEYIHPVHHKRLVARVTFFYH